MSIMCNNATSNDKMIDELAGQLLEFSGVANHAWCFTHILNLVVKSIMHQFDVAYKQKDKHDMMDKQAYKLKKLARDIEMEELATQADSDNEDEGPPHNNEEGWIDEWLNMTEDEIDNLEKSIQPIHFLLTKVSDLYMNCTVFAKQSTQIRKLTFTIKNSSTIALPQWYQILETLSLDTQVMPHDVHTRWNATYDMLDFTYRYK